MDNFLFDHRLELFSSILTACKKVLHLITVSDSLAEEVATGQALLEISL